MIRLNSRALIIALTLLMLVGAAIGVAAAASTVSAADTVEGEVSVTEHGQEEKRPEDEAVEAFSLKGAVPSDIEREAREALMTEWEALNEERELLLEELHAVHQEMHASASELWEYEMNDARDRLRERLNEFGGHYGDELLEWLPPRLIEHIADFTGRTPEEVRDMVRGGDWGELL